MSPPIIHTLRKFKHWCLHRTTFFGREISVRGIAYYPYQGEDESDFFHVIESPESLLNQLQELRKKNLCTYRNRKFELTWEQVYALVTADDPVVVEQLGLADVDFVQVAVVSAGRVGCPSLKIWLEQSKRTAGPGFHTIAGNPIPFSTGGKLLTPDNYYLMREVASFHSLPLAVRASEEGEAAWCRVVYLSQAAGADLSRLTTERTTLSLERLRIVADVSSGADGQTLEIVPYFSGSPQNWKSTFLGSNELPGSYQVPGKKGQTQVDVCAEVAPIIFDARRLNGRLVQPNSPLMRHLQVIDQSDLEDMSPEAFELVCALIYRKSGYPESFRVGGSGDGGVDVVALRGNQGLLLQCKSSKELDKRLGWEGVKDVVAGEAGYRKQYPGVQFQKLALTNQFFNETARSQAQLNNVILLDKTAILKEIRKLHISYFEMRHFSNGAV